MSACRHARGRVGARASASPIPSRCACRSRCRSRRTPAKSGSQWRFGVVDRRQAEVGGQLGERDRLLAARRVAADLRRRRAAGPTAGRCRAGSAARRCRRTTPRSSSRCRPARTRARGPCPSPQEELAGEARVVREAQRPLDVVLVHVGEARRAGRSSRGACRRSGSGSRVNSSSRVARRTPSPAGSPRTTSSYTHQSAIGPSRRDDVVTRRRGPAPGPPGSGSTRGPRSRCFAGSQRSHRSGGSTTWSSAEITQGRVRPASSVPAAIVTLAPLQRPVACSAPEP